MPTSFIENEVRAGHQAYVICPMVEASEMLEAENVIDYTEELQPRPCPPCDPDRISSRKNEGQKKKMRSWNAFAANEIQVLVSTTVIEVGINVPNATVMMIENAERFGLAQLHQLRGRVGRGGAQSYCIFHGISLMENRSSERLDILCKSNDGFEIANRGSAAARPGRSVWCTSERYAGLCAG